MNFRYILISVLGFCVISLGCQHFMEESWSVPIAMLLIGWWDSYIEFLKND